MLWDMLRRGHQQYQARLSEYLDNRLDAAARSRLEEHLESCTECRSEVESLKATVSLLRLAPMVEPPRSFRLQATPVPSPSRRRPVLLWSMQVSTAIAAVLFALLLIGDYAGLFGDGVAPADQGLGLPRQEAQLSAAGTPVPAPASGAAEPRISTEALPPPPGPLPTPAPIPQQVPTLATDVEVPGATGRPQPTVAATPAAEKTIGATDRAAASAEEGIGATGEAAEEKGVNTEPIAAPAGEPAGPIDVLDTEAGSVVTKIQIAVGAFLGVLALATAYLTLRRCRAGG